MSLPQIDGLNDRVVLQRREITPEDEGGHTGIWVPMVTLWARVTALGGGRSTASDGRGVEASHSVVVRYRPAIRPGDRFVYRGRHLEVLSAEDLSGRRAFTACRCNERQVTG